MNDWRNGRNHCYTYFKITGDFNPDDITRIIGLNPSKCWHTGELRKDGTPFDFSLWEYGRCNEYDVYVENQMMKTIQDLILKMDILCKIKELYKAYFTLEIVPSIYVGEINPCLAPNREVIEFCYKTETEIDIDMYVFDSIDE